MPTKLRIKTHQQLLNERLDIEGPISRLHPRNPAQIRNDYKGEREALIEQIIRRAEVTTIVAETKLKKSWLILQLALCLAAGLDFLGFKTRKCRILYLGYELSWDTLSVRLGMIAEKMDVELVHLGDSLLLDSLRGCQLPLGTLEDCLRLQYPPGSIDLIILDSFFNVSVGDPTFRENDNNQMAAVYAKLQRIAERWKLGIIVIHHTSKGDQSDKGLTDLGSGAGSQSRATDNHLSFRSHREPGCAVLDGASRTFLPMTPTAIRWADGIWTLAPDLNPEDIRVPKRRKHQKEKPQNINGTPLPNTPEAFVAAYLKPTPRFPTGIVDEATRAGMTKNRAHALLLQAEERGLIYTATDARNRPLYATVPLVNHSGNGIGRSAASSVSNAANSGSKNPRSSLRIGVRAANATCQVCGRAFEAERKTAKYCGNSCKMKARQQRQPEE